MFDLISATRQARKTYEALVSIRGAIVAGGDPDALKADAEARFKELAQAMGYFADPIDDAARVTVEGKRHEEEIAGVRG